MATSKQSSGSRSGSKRKRSSAESTKEPPSKQSPTGGDEDDAEEGGMSKAEEANTGGKAMGRPPADEPDVYVFVPEVSVGELKIDVERLDAHLALRAEVANLVNLVAGVHVGVDKVKIDLKDVKAECELKVRLENTYNILDRTLTTLDENPDIVKGLLETADSAVETTGQIGQQATKPGGALSELTSGVGDTLGNLGSSIGDGLSSIAGKASPKQLTSGAAGNGASSSNGSNGSSIAKRAAAAGAAGIIGGALIGLSGRNGGGSVGKRLSKARKTIYELASGCATRRIHPRSDPTRTSRSGRRGAQAASAGATGPSCARRRSATSIARTNSRRCRRAGPREDAGDYVHGFATRTAVADEG